VRHYCPFHELPAVFVHIDDDFKTTASDDKRKWWSRNAAGDSPFSYRVNATSGTANLSNRQAAVRRHEARRQR
jgi:hypothetical protein